MTSTIIDREYYVEEVYEAVDPPHFLVKYTELTKRDHRKDDEEHLTWVLGEAQTPTKFDVDGRYLHVPDQVWDTKTVFKCLTRSFFYPFRDKEIFTSNKFPTMDEARYKAIELHEGRHQELKEHAIQVEENERIKRESYTKKHTI